VLTVTAGSVRGKERVDIWLKDVLESMQVSRSCLYLGADKDALRRMVQVMDVVKRAGIDRLCMVTRAGLGSSPAWGCFQERIGRSS
jgi:biopolymer transport protein ExbD